MRARLDQIVIDDEDPPSLSRFWASLLGGDVVDRARGWSHVEPPGFPRLGFQPGARARGRTKNRLHLDVEVHDIEAAVREAQAAGATRVEVPATTELGTYQVMTDPEGNEFCFVRD